MWKERFLTSLGAAMANLSHIHVEDSLTSNEEIVNRYIEKLKTFPTYYEILVNKIFKYIVVT
jgi:hypothetical protein